MALFWIVNKHEGARRVFLQEGSYVVMARLKANLAGHEGEFVEAHDLGAAMARKVPKKMIGRVLTADEAEKLLEKMD
jgi:hypothetical protein